MRKIWNMAEETADKNVEKKFLEMSMMLWMAVSVVIGITFGKLNLVGGLNEFENGFIFSGYFVVIMFLFSYIFICRRG